jgi:hypothetical protein
MKVLATSRKPENTVRERPSNRFSRYSGAVTTRLRRYSGSITTTKITRITAGIHS